MKWENLKSNKCPKCSSLLTDAKIDKRYSCPSFDCNFTIAKEKFDKIVNDLYKPKARRCGTSDNFEALQNLGHNGISPIFTTKRHE